MFKLVQSKLTLIFLHTLGILLFAPTHARSLDAQEQPTEKWTPAQIAFFESKIRPALIEHCYECHSQESEELGGQLRLDHRAGILAGGDLGPAIDLKEPAESLLLSALRHDDLEMPPSGKLPDSVIADFDKWIRAGAADPRLGGKQPTRSKIDLDAGKKFWFFQPRKEMKFANASRFIDQQIENRLKANGLQLNSPADRFELLERLSFDLTGLPPEQNLIDEFVSGKLSYENVVDSMLTSPHFGEHFARHWLDVARYADSSGGGRILLFPDAWRYRDYVVDAFHSDKPFDQFVKEQIAGDLLNLKDRTANNLAKTATGFLMLGAHNFELQDKELLRMEVVDEQINVVSRSFMGLTVSCARCHDHKFDPIPTDDYYSLAGIFFSTKSLLPGNVSNFVTTPLDLPEKQQQELREFEAKRKPIADEISKWEKELKQLSGESSVTSTPVKKLAGIALDDNAAKHQGDWTKSQAIKPYVESGYQHSSQAGATADYLFKLEGAMKFEIRAAHTPGANRTSEAIYRITIDGKTTEKRVDQKKQPSLKRHFESLGNFEINRAGKVLVQLCASGSGVTISDAVQILPIGESRTKAPGNQTVEAMEKVKLRQARSVELRKKISAFKKELTRLEKKRPKSPAKVMSVQEEQKPGDIAVRIRGNVHRSGEMVQRRALQVIDYKTPFAKQIKGSGRLELANWLVAPDNPLTARVYVNRVWSWLFGQGLVRSTDNFGKMGTLPTHSDLLDGLANELIKQGWSTKKLVKSIVLSRSYRQSSAATDLTLKLDADNRLLSRFPAKRLPAEAIRDRILSFSGQLDIKTGGPAIKPNTRSEFGYVYDSTRRSIYLPVFRNTLNDLFDVFDFPNPNLVSGTRSSSTLPTQALYLMNSDFVMKHSRLAAERILNSESKSLPEKIRLAYRLALSREPSKSEIAIANQFFSDASSSESNIDAWQQFCQILISSIDFQNLK